LVGLLGEVGCGGGVVGGCWACPWADEGVAGVGVLSPWGRGWVAGVSGSCGWVGAIVLGPERQQGAGLRGVAGHLWGDAAGGGAP